jgi:hypothetical protein
MITHSSTIFPTKSYLRPALAVADTSICMR